MYKIHKNSSQQVILVMQLNVHYTETVNETVHEHRQQHIQMNLDNALLTKINRLF